MSDERMTAGIVCGFGCGCDHDPGRLCVYEARFMGAEGLARTIKNHTPVVDRHDGTVFCPACYDGEGHSSSAPCVVYRLAARLVAVEGDVLLLASAAEDVVNCYVMAPSEATGSTATHIEQMGYVLEGMTDRLRSLAATPQPEGGE